MLLTIKETAKILKISTSTLYRWKSQKKIECIKIGSRVIFSQESLDKFIKENTISSE